MICRSNISRRLAMVKITSIPQYADSEVSYDSGILLVAGQS